MFCFKCGRPVTEGKAFCRHCGAPIPATPRPRGGRLARFIQKNRAGLTFAVVTLCIVLLLGGVFLVYAVMSGAPPEAGLEEMMSTTSPGESQAVAAGGSSTTSTAGTTASQLPASSTTMTTVLPPTTLSTTPVPTTNPPTTTTTQQHDDRRGTYQAVADRVVRTLNAYAERIVQLGSEIETSAPSVPRSVAAELQDMLDDLQAAYDDLGRALLPSGYEGPDRLLEQALIYMSYRIRYALDGIQAMWQTGRASAANSSFAKARQARDRSSVALNAYRLLVAMR
jgi:hypothetical protein